MIYPESIYDFLLTETNNKGCHPKLKEVMKEFNIVEGTAVKKLRTLHHEGKIIFKMKEIQEVIKPAVDWLRKPILYKS